MRIASVLPVQRVPEKKASGGARRVMVLSTKNGLEISNIVELPAKRNGILVVIKDTVVCSALDSISLADVGIVDLSHIPTVDDLFEGLVQKILQEERRHVHVVLNRHPEVSRPQASFIRRNYAELSRTHRVWQDLSRLRLSIERILT